MNSFTGRRGWRRAALASAALCALAAAPGASARSVVRFTPDVRVLGEASPESVVHFQMALALRDGAGLTRSNQAGRTMSYADLERRHLPTRADYGAAAAWLTAQGLTIEKTWEDRLTIEAAGTAGAVSRALGAHFSRILSEGQVFVSADSEPVLPAAFAGRAVGVNGLQPHLHAHGTGVAHPLSIIRPPLFPAAWISAYSAQGLGDGGAGTRTAIVIDTFPKLRDLTKFWSITKVAQSLTNIALIQAVPGNLPAPGGEESLEVETASSVAPNSKVRVYASKTLGFGNLDTAFQAVIHDLRGGMAITQVALTIGACETSVSESQAETDDNFFAVMSSLGASVFAPSGDSGSHACGPGTSEPSFYGTSPNVTAVGGTSLKLKEGGEVQKEYGWSGSGGGVSTKFARPAYQIGTGYSMRATPDVAADANPSTGALMILDGDSFEVGGTALAAPIWAGLTALINASRSAASKPPLGLLNGRLYPLAQTDNFRDITMGSNGGFDAAAGYDLVTGLGAPVMSRLHPTLVAQP